MKIYAVIPARSGSKGLPDKNIRKLAGHELLGYSIAFAKSLGFDMVLCSTDSARYAAIAQKYGADVPFLRSEWAARDKSMEQDILKDMYEKFEVYQIPIPDLIVWLRPTFVFRDEKTVLECVERMVCNPSLTACRVVVESESRLYKLDGEKLKPTFPTFGCSMIRRQDVGLAYRVFCTDVFRGGDASENFLGDSVGAVVADKICGVDIDDEFDFNVAESIIQKMQHRINRYVKLKPKIDFGQK